MANLTFLSAATLESHKDILSDCIAKQGIPEVVVLQLTEKYVGVPVMQDMLASVFAVVPREDGGYSLKVSLYSKEAGFKLGGWVVAYPEAVVMPEGRAVVRVNKAQANALAAFEPKKSSLFFDLSGTKCLSLKLALGVESHYIKDSAGNKIPSGELDAKGNKKFQLAEHPVLTFCSGFISAPLCGTGITGDSMTQDDVAAVEERLEKLLAADSTPKSRIESL